MPRCRTSRSRSASSASGGQAQWRLKPSGTCSACRPSSRKARTPTSLTSTSAAPCRCVRRTSSSKNQVPGCSAHRKIARAQGSGGAGCSAGGASANHSCGGTRTGTTSGRGSGQRAGGDARGDAELLQLAPQRLDDLHEEVVLTGGEHEGELWHPRSDDARAPNRTVAWARSTGMHEAVVPERFVPAALAGTAGRGGAPRPLLVGREARRWAARARRRVRHRVRHADARRGRRRARDGRRPGHLRPRRRAALVPRERRAGRRATCASCRSRDRSFDLVVCFEVIEHLEEPDAALRELERVVAADGVVLVSSPNRDVYEPGNPHHLHEYTPRRAAPGAAAVLRPRRAAPPGEPDRLGRHARRRRRPAASSTPSTTCGWPSRRRAARRRDVHDRRGQPRAARRPTAPPPPSPPASPRSAAGSSSTTSSRRWSSAAARPAAPGGRGARGAPRARGAAGRRARARRAAKADEDLRAAREEIAVLHERLARAAAAMTAVKRSPSWRLTAPLRALKRPLRRR